MQYKYCLGINQPRCILIQNYINYFLNDYPDNGGMTSRFSKCICMSLCPLSIPLPKMDEKNIIIVFYQVI